MSGRAGLDPSVELGDHSPRRLHPEDRALLERVADLLEQLCAEPAAPGVLVDAKAVAKRLGRRPAWVYRHADELGAQRLTNGPKPRLMFDLERVTAVSVKQSSSTRRNGSSERKTGSRAPAAKGTKTRLLPVGRKGRNAR